MALISELLSWERFDKKPHAYYAAFTHSSNSLLNGLIKVKIQPYLQLAYIHSTLEKKSKCVK